MKKLYLCALIFFCAPFLLSAQSKGSYTVIHTIKQPYFSFNATKYQDTKKSFQKVNGMMISDNQKFLVISYSSDPTHFAIYKVGTWDRVGVYKIMGTGVELYGSYFSPDDKFLFVRYDRYSTEYKMIDLKTTKVKKIDCEKTPRGCNYVEVQQEYKEVYTKNRKFFLEISSTDPSDVLVYIKQLK